MRLRNLLIFVAILSLELAGGCSLLPPRPEDSRFYVLTANAGAASIQPVQSVSRQLAIGLGPVKFPDYLQHTEVVTRVSRNRIDLSSTDRWAEPLDESFKRVLTRNLQTLLGTGQVIQFPWYPSVTLNYKIELTVERFERDGSGGTQLVATWLILDGHTDQVLLSRQSNFSASATQTGTADSSRTGAQAGPAGSDGAGTSMDSAAAALSTDLSDLSQQIASAITDLNSTRHARPPD